MQGGAGAKNGLALVRQMCNVGELMAVELENGAEGLLLVPLAAEAVSNVMDILVKHVNLGFVGQSFVTVLLDLVLVI